VRVSERHRPERTPSAAIAAVVIVGTFTADPPQSPERTIREAKVMEAGSVAFPADEGTTAGVRSLRDWLEAA
jgi:hypothetical protein